MKRKVSKPGLFNFRADYTLLVRISEFHERIGGNFTSSAVVRRAIELGLERLEQDPALMVPKEAANG